MTLQDTYLSRKIHLTVFYTFNLHYPQGCANFYSFFECYFMTLNCNANSINGVSFILISIIIGIALHALSNLGCSFPCFKIALWGVYSGFHGNYDTTALMGWLQGKFSRINCYGNQRSSNFHGNPCFTPRIPWQPLQHPRVLF